jgi:hypothetical protein
MFQWERIGLVSKQVYKSSLKPLEVVSSEVFCFEAIIIHEYPLYGVKSCVACILIPQLYFL